MSECNRCGNDTHEDELKFNFGVCDGCDQNKEKSNDRAFSTGWAVIKSGMNPRLPKEGSMDGVLSRNPDPPAMNAGMPRDPDLLARLKRMKERKDKER